ncbi:MAG: hypothetical protein KME10_03530 [Plectolyngbya sp. WJT66-NPBG17]|jgi:hypothetical protein|nr:hypothetical protein [Plectolyngbya sp. WJT66-NPBG17]
MNTIAISDLSFFENCPLKHTLKGGAGLIPTVSIAVQFGTLNQASISALVKSSSAAGAAGGAAAGASAGATSVNGNAIVSVGVGVNAGSGVG